MNYKKRSHKEKPHKKTCIESDEIKKIMNLKPDLSKERIHRGIFINDLSKKNITDLKREKDLSNETISRAIFDLSEENIPDLKRQKDLSNETISRGIFINDLSKKNIPDYKIKAREIVSGIKTYCDKIEKDQDWKTKLNSLFIKIKAEIKDEPLLLEELEPLLTLKKKVPKEQLVTTSSIHNPRLITPQNTGLSRHEQKKTRNKKQNKSSKDKKTFYKV